MADRKIIAVVGATGAQGGGLVRALLNDSSGPFSVRALTRHPDSDKARTLRDDGAEVVAADIDDLQSVTRAFDGAYGAYCVTNFWEHRSPEREFTQGSNLAHAAKAAGIQHAIWSTFEDVRRFVPLSDTRMPTLMGKYKVPHFDAKAEVDGVFRSLGVPTTFYLTCFYWDNFISLGAGPKKGPDGQYAITFPLGNKRMSGVAAADIGAVAYGIFKAGPAHINRMVGVAGEHLTGSEMAASLSTALGVPVMYNNVPADVYRSFGFPGADEMGNMFQFYAEFEEPFTRSRDVAKARALYPQLQTFDQWLAANAKRIPLDA
jgi:uncharacterized protein YbjT (DUF2867 family)